jgi:hypothetical protein
LSSGRRGRLLLGAPYVHIRHRGVIFTCLELTVPEAVASTIFAGFGMLLRTTYHIPDAKLVIENRKKDPAICSYVLLRTEFTEAKNKESVKGGQMDRAEKAVISELDCAGCESPKHQSLVVGSAGGRGALTASRPHYMLHHRYLMHH